MHEDREWSARNASDGMLEKEKDERRMAESARGKGLRDYAADLDQWADGYAAMAKYASDIADHHARLKTKWNRAAANPWSTVPADPPSPAMWTGESFAFPASLTPLWRSR